MNNFTAMLLIVLSLGSAFFFGRPMFTDVNDLRTKEDQYAATIESLHSVQSMTASLQQKLNSLSPEDRQKIDGVLPQKPDTVKLLSDIDAMASSHGIAIDNASFSNANQDKSSSVAGAPTNLPYQAGLLNFEFNASYVAFKAFLDDIQSSLRLVDVQAITATVGQNGLMSYKVNLEIYWLPPSSK